MTVVWASYPPNHHRAALQPGWHPWGDGQALPAAQAEALAAAARSLGARVELRPAGDAPAEAPAEPVTAPVADLGPLFRRVAWTMRHGATEAGRQ